MTKILFIIGSSKAHHLHGAMANSIGANNFVSNLNKNYGLGTVGKIFNLIKSVITLPSGYDIYFSETVFIIPVLAKVLGIIPKKSIIINISADPLLYDFVYKENKTIMDKLQFKLIKHVNGFVIIGSWGFLLKKLNMTVPFFELDGGVEDKRFEKLLRINLNKKPRNNNIVFVGNVTPDRFSYKGIDILMGAFSKVQLRYPDAKLYITGQSSGKFDVKNLIFTGFKDTDGLVKTLSDMTLAVNASRGDTFPIGSVEAMASGVPVFVSDVTGTKTIVEVSDPSFIISLSTHTSDELAKRIIKYLELSQSERIRIGKKFREAARPYSETKAIGEFKLKFGKLVESIKKDSN